MDAEFEIIKHPKKVLIFSISYNIQAQKRAASPKPKEKPEALKPAWTDDDEVDQKRKIAKYAFKFNAHFFSQPLTIDISARLKWKKAKDSDEQDVITDKAFTVLRGNEHLGVASSKNLYRTHDANQERLSCGPLSSVEFNTIYSIFLTASSDTTMALFNVRFEPFYPPIDKGYHKHLCYIVLCWHFL